MAIVGIFIITIIILILRCFLRKYRARHAARLEPAEQENGNNNSLNISPSKRELVDDSYDSHTMEFIINSD